ncbi:hypothetical protein LTR78_002049 [Recurvomyces mirabilis]|uniref:Uncharacterized protein n=1 Tax=Recurvomyces mirabilis TaxID=574656 RepID=A0AAE0WTM0_9PEZI|nr:hypothetical protein LTR78_002049 [Recurvomyces mirabilis]KAK5160507.1 hypothetical protein LTS14_001519 [Recurvomyces mirabilis]
MSFTSWRRNDASPSLSPAQQIPRKLEAVASVRDDKIPSYKQRSQLSWRPHIIRSWTLICLLIITLGLIAVLEYISHTLPGIITTAHSLTTTSSTTSVSTHASPSIAQKQATSLTEVRVGYRARTAFAASNTTTTSRPSSAYSLHSEPEPSTTVGTAYLGSAGSQIATKSSTSVTASETVGAPPAGSYLHTDGPNPKNDDATGQWHWNGTQIFVGTYLPVLIAMIYRMLWTAIYHGFCLIEPFQQLYGSRGSLANSAFFELYQARTVFTPLIALRRKRWILAAVALTQTLTTLLPGLAAESIHPDTNWGCSQPSNDKNNPCPPRITMNIPVIRVLQGIVSLAALVLIVAVLVTYRKQTGVARDPSSIAAVASLMRHPSLLAELQNLPADASKKKMMSALEGHRYSLSSWQDSFRDRHYGVLPMQTYGESSLSKADEPLMGPSDKPVNAKSHWHKYGGEWIVAIFTIGTFAVVLAYCLDGQDDGFNRFFSSNTFGPRLILTTSATVLATRWRSEEQKMMTMAPYQRLANGPAPARSTLYFQSHLTPVFSTIYTVRHGYYVVASLTLMTLLAEGLSVVISGVPFAPAEVWQQLIISVGMSLAILALMLIVVLVLVVYRRSEIELPRHPDTLGVAMSYVCGSRFLDILGELDSPKASATVHAESLDKLYEFRKKVRIDGKTAWTMDECAEDPLLRAK